MAILLSTATLPSNPIKLSLKLCSDGITDGHPTTAAAATVRLVYGLSKKDEKNKYTKKLPFVSLCLKNESLAQTTQKNSGKIPRKGREKLVSSEGKEEDESYGLICPGCGVFMQDKDPDLPGYYQKRNVSAANISEDEGVQSLSEDEFGEEEEEFLDDIEDSFEESDGEEENLERGDGVDWDMVKKWEAELEDEIEKQEDWKKELDGFAPPSVGYGNITEETLEAEKKRKISKAERKRLAREAEKEREDVTVCARCHSLRNSGQVKNPTAENLIPDFDFDRLIANRLMKPAANGNATVVVMVVDCVDFDGSFPKRAAKSLFEALEESKDRVKTSKKLPKLVLVATKVDLLPSQVSPTRLDSWVRRRAKVGGAPKLSGVYLVSARKDLGVRNLLSFIKELAGPRGNVWVIGAQNAGKSTLINAFTKKEGAKLTKLTEAAVPGTTLGILRIGGILSAKAKMYDTPGLLHPYLMSMRLNRDEQKMVEIRKELQPRTYRMKAGQVVHVGGIMRLDVNQASTDTIYVTIWVSPNVSLHMGKIENADEMWKKHAGFRLQPPIGTDQSKMGKWVEKEIKVSGISWDVNSIDIAAAGLGWFSVGLKGEATLTLWTYDGIQITVREPLVLDRAPFLERPGFWLPKAISDAIGNQTKQEAQARKRLQEESREELTEVPA
ncbi:GTP-binding protein BRASSINAZOLE INSENSITIVE PALE GREEN 2, chloroplastic isoform X2 [Malania oleifera]|uniref:GTP-binding protein BRASSINAZOLE INSENSITIVE PALE GREEN 2, chloroplastic isoform X2 n=1 Tax=Malania oleifera TaxID=397392 RepID=UPI0025AEB818|nr:GTP-binding protein BRASSINAZOLE INSENSITIVE PALE GREEN 2, chloroplastic isoform X2 [Malania oleifera]